MALVYPPIWAIVTIPAILPILNTSRVGPLVQLRLQITQSSAAIHCSVIRPMGGLGNQRSGSLGGRGGLGRSNRSGKRHGILESVLVRDGICEDNLHCVTPTCVIWLTSHHAIGTPNFTTKRKLAIFTSLSLWVTVIIAWHG